VRAAARNLQAAGREGAIRRLSPGPEAPRRGFWRQLSGSDVFNSTIGRGQTVLTRVSAFWLTILEVWLLFLVSFYLAKYVAVGFAFVPIYTVLVNGLTHVIASLALRRYNPGLYTSLLLFPWGIYLLVYFNAATGPSLVFNVIGLLVGIVGHAIIVVYALRRRSRLESGSRRGAAASL
jgi:hypothetical protein